MRKWEGYEHGVNLGGWLSQCNHTKERYDTFIQEADIQRISSWKQVDHIRVPVDYNLVETPEGSYREEGFHYIEQAIAWCRKYRLRMILDLHKTYGYSFDEGEHESGFFENEKYQERFYRLWETFASRFGAEEDMLAFELLNEVTDKECSDAWNRISGECIRRIRRIAPTIRILVGGYYNNSIAAVPDLAPPADENIVYNFHCYEPLIFTHQGAYWVPTMDTAFRTSIDKSLGELRRECAEQVPWAKVFPEASAESRFDAELVKAYFRTAVDVAQERNVPLYCGEYGVIDRADPEDTLRWYRVMHEAFSFYGIGRAAWSYREMDFGLTDPGLDSVREELLALL